MSKLSSSVLTDIKFIGLFLFIFSSQCFGNSSSPLVPLPSVSDYSQGKGWGAALGFGVEFESSYDGSDEKEFEIDPAGSIHYRQENSLFFLEGFEAGVRWLSGPSHLWQALIRREGGREEDDSEDRNLNGLSEREDVWVGALEYRYDLSGQWKRWLGGRIMAGDSDFGFLGILALGQRFSSRQDGLGTEAFIFATYGNEDFMFRDFGISPSESVTSGLPAYDPGSGFRSFGLEMIDKRRFGSSWELISKAGVEAYSSKVKQSSISRSSSEIEIGTTLVYRF